MRSFAAYWESVNARDGIVAPKTEDVSAFTSEDQKALSKEQREAAARAAGFNF